MEKRKFNCKNEELPVIGGFLSSSMKRDIVQFENLSPKFDEGYILKFDASIETCSALVNPKEETAEIKIITQRLYTVFNETHEKANSLEFYLKLAKSTIPVSAADFGITALRKKLMIKDAEGVLQNLHIVIDQTVRYQTELVAVGMPLSFVEQLNGLYTAISNDNLLQYEMMRNRRELVESNVHTLNDLFAYIQEICDAGKLLFRGKDPVKVEEYTFRDLLKKVRIVHRKPQTEE
jgi:hypothetical protein